MKKLLYLRAILFFLVLREADPCQAQLEIPIIQSVPLHPLASIRNPSAGFTQHPLVFIGVQQLYTGYESSINQQIIGMVYSRQNILFCLDYYQWQHKFQNEGTIRVSGGYHWRGWVNSLNIGYRYSAYKYPPDQYEAGDPVLEKNSLHALILGGSTAFNWHQFQAGLSFDQFNRPDYSFDKSYTLPLETSGEIRYRQNLSNWQLIPAIGWQTQSEWYFALGSEFTPISAGIEILISRTYWQWQMSLFRLSVAIPISLHYYGNFPRNELANPGISHHGFFLSYTFGTRPPPTSAPEPAKILPPFSPPRYELAFTPHDSLVVEEILKVNEINPIIPIMFFKFNSDSLFSPDTIPYYVRHPYFYTYNQFILKAVAEHLLNNPNERLILEGIQDSSEADPLLWQRRIIRVRNILTEKWAIPYQQIRLTQTPGEPINPTNNPLLTQENASVKLAFQTTELAPVYLDYELLQSFKTPLNLALHTDEEELSAQISITDQNRAPLWETTLNRSNQTEDFLPGNSGDNLPALTDTLYVHGQIYSSKRKEGEIKASIPIRRHQAKIEEEKRIRVFLFDFDEYKNQSALYKQKIDTIYKILLKDNPPAITINGFTDEIGDAGYNQRLALKRAAFIRDELIQRGWPAKRITIKAVGPHQPIVDERLPWGRILNRRAEVIYQK